MIIKKKILVSKGDKPGFLRNNRRNRLSPSVAEEESSKVAVDQDT